ncbi:hypothetical protein SESBI_48524, partial [Sesbania bispinosa]
MHLQPKHVVVDISSDSESECVDEDHVNVNEVDLGREGVYKFEKGSLLSKQRENRL